MNTNAEFLFGPRLARDSHSRSVRSIFGSYSDIVKDRDAGPRNYNNSCTSKVAVLTQGPQVFGFTFGKCQVLGFLERLVSPVWHAGIH